MNNNNDHEFARSLVRLHLLTTIRLFRSFRNKARLDAALFDAHTMILLMARYGAPDSVRGYLLNRIERIRFAAREAV